MENFKKALKQGIIDKAEAVRFEESQVPNLMLYAAERSLSHLPQQSRNEVLQLIESLLPMNQPTPLLVREGVLSIVNFGELKLLASTSDPAKLFAFIPPQGNQMFQQIKNQMLNISVKPAPKPINVAEDLPSTFTRNEQPGHFAIGQVTGQVTSEGIAAAPSSPEKAGDATIPLAEKPMPTMGMTVPPVPKLVSSSSESPIAVQSRPRMEKTVPVEFAPESDGGTEIKQSKTDETRASTVIREERSALFQKEEYTDAEDYHFNQSNQSMSRGPNEFTNTYAAIHTPSPGSSPKLVALTSEEDEPEEPKIVAAPEKTIIHFGATIPGESIERKGKLPIDTLLEQIVERRASDLHLTLAERACMRIDGEILRFGETILNEDQMRSYLLPIMPPKNRDEFARINDTDFAYEVPGLARFRVNIFRDRMGVGAVLRQIPDKVLSADELGLPPPIRKFCELHKGLVVVTGPTGSGKSTTLAAMVDLINESRSDHILTIEDPIEFVHQQKRCLIHQREVFKHTQSFSRALRAALREDPDIILIGEMRDLETVEIAIETAETGHLVFGTLHTNTAISTVDRLIDQFAAEQQEQIRVMLAESLKGVVAQTLVKKKGGGRVAAHEILVVDKAVASLIREGNTHMVQNHMQTQKAKGNCTLNDALMALVTKGLVEARDAYAKAVEKEAFAAMLQQKGITLDPSAKTA